MAIPSIVVAKSASAKNWAQGGVYVDAESVVAVIGAVERAVLPGSLMTFLTTMVSPYFEEVIVDQFADHGSGTPGGSWDPLSEGTLRIRHALGYYDDDAVNERSGELLYHVAMTRKFSYTADGGVNMQIPEDSNDGLLNRKLETAQSGFTQSSNDMLPDAQTPARPVLPQLDADDLIAVTKMLQTYIMGKVSAGFPTIGTLP